MDPVSVTMQASVGRDLSSVPGLQLPEPLVKVAALSGKLAEIRRDNQGGSNDLSQAGPAELAAAYEASIEAHMRSKVIGEVDQEFEAIIASRTVRALNESRDDLWAEYQRLAGGLVEQLDENLAEVPADMLGADADTASYGATAMAALGRAAEAAASLDQYDKLRHVALGDLSKTSLGPLYLARELPQHRDDQLHEAMNAAVRGVGTLRTLAPIAHAFGLAVPEDRRARHEELTALETGPSQRQVENERRIAAIRRSEQKVNWGAALTVR